MPFPRFETLKTVKNRNATFFGSEEVYFIPQTAKHIFEG